MATYEELNLSEREFQILQSELETHKRSVGVAYLLLVFLGGFGGHMFYMGRWGMGILYSFLTIFSIFSFGSTLIILGILLIYDLFTLSNQIDKRRQEKKEEIISNIRSQSRKNILNEIENEKEF